MTTITHTMTANEFWHRFRSPLCTCEHGLANHKPWGMQHPCMEMDGCEPCLCMDYSPAEPGDVRDDDGMGVPA